MENNEKIDFLAIGDIILDAFIKLKDARIDTDPDEKDHGMDEICFRFGDKVPYESVTVVPAVGNAPNASVTAARLGLKTALITNIGDDKHGSDCLESLKKDGVLTEYITKEKDKITNYHYVLWYEVDRTILIKHTKFEYQFPEIGGVAWVYLSSLAENSLLYHDEIITYLKKYPNTKLAFQPGTFQLKFGTEKLKEIYARTEIFFCNKEEAEIILNVKTTDIKILIEGIHKLGPKIVCISDGPKGSYAYDGENIYFIPMYPDIAPPVDRTGAGDAFSSTFAVAIASGKTIQEALQWGPINSMAVVQEIGAQKGLLTREKLEKYLQNAPVDYVAKKI
jgi:ribokinase